MYHAAFLLAVFTTLILAGCYAPPSATVQPMANLPTLEPLPSNTPLPMSTHTPLPTATRTRIPSPTATASSTPTQIPTNVPVGTFAILFYKPLVLSYDPQAWQDKSEYRNSQRLVNYLQANNLTSCQITTQGPTDFNRDEDDYIWGKVLLGEVDYATLQFTEPMNGETMRYFAESPLPGYDHNGGVPTLAIVASEEEWEACKAVGEEVLATLHAGGQ